MKVMFTVQGEGRGHMTQAIALKEILQRHGCSVTSVLAGGNLSKSLPSFFEQAFDTPVQRIASPGFTQKKNRGISLPASLVQAVTKAPALRGALATIKENIARHQPDLIVNFLEPMMGVYNLLHKHRTPVLSVGHQFMQRHPTYIKVKEFPFQQIGIRRYIQTTGARSHHLALSFYRAEDTPKMTVCPPILRNQLFGLKPVAGDYILVYVVFYGFAEDIVRWCKANPGVPVHCFCDRPDAPEEEKISENLTFHRVHGEKFLQMMANCRAVVCTAGFEAVSEAAYLGKPSLVVPVENHLEQFLNATEVEKCGLGLRDSAFNLSRLLEYKPSTALASFKQWVDQAERIFLTAVEKTTGQRISAS
jgi:uncharacterized protein (TIGR00661 family)